MLTVQLCYILTAAIERSRTKYQTYLFSELYDQRQRVGLDEVQ